MEAESAIIWAAIFWASRAFVRMVPESVILPGVCQPWVSIRATYMLVNEGSMTYLPGFMQAAGFSSSKQRSRLRGLWAPAPLTSESITVCTEVSGRTKRTYFSVKLGRLLSLYQRPKKKPVTAPMRAQDAIRIIIMFLFISVIV